MNKLNILDEISTIQYLINNICSISRFGDGEFMIINGDSIHF